MFVAVLRIKPLKEYSPPLHLNQLVFDTLFKGGTEVYLEPRGVEPVEYSVVVVASPIWINRLASPTQGFLRGYVGKLSKYVLVVTSELRVSCERITNMVEKIARVKPIACFNVRDNEIRDPGELSRVANVVASAIVKLAG